MSFNRETTKKCFNISKRVNNRCLLNMKPLMDAIIRKRRLWKLFPRFIDSTRLFCPSSAKSSIEEGVFSFPNLNFQSSPPVPTTWQSHSHRNITERNPELLSEPTKRGDQQSSTGTGDWATCNRP